MYRSLAIQLVLLPTLFLVAGCSDQEDKNGYRGGGFIYFGGGSMMNRSASGTTVPIGGSVSRGGFGRTGVGIS